MRMYDAVDVEKLPEGGDVYAGYVNGGYRNVDEIRRKFPGVRVLGIDVTGGANADVLDVETYDATPQQAPGWLRRNPGGWVYCNESTWGQVRYEVASAGLTCKYWIAKYDGVAEIPASWVGMGCVAKQWYSGDWDESNVLDDAFGERDDEDMIWGSDTMTENQRIVDGRNAQIRAWWRTFRGEEIGAQQQQTAYGIWAQKGGDLCLAAIIDGTIG